jgi:hypothetical protein
VGATNRAAPGIDVFLVGVASGGAASQLKSDGVRMEAQGMTDDDCARRLDEMNRVLNDPELPMQPALIWRLVAEISEHELQAGTVLPPHVLSPCDPSRRKR